jgi:hypothetical protein
MGFYSGSSTTPGIVNLMADKLMASDSKFTNPYASLTRYTGDGNDVEYGITCYQRRVLKWEDPAKSGQEKTMYVVFQIPFWDVNQAMFQTRSDAAYYMFGIEVIVSTSWNSTTHAPDGDIQRTFIPVVQWGTAGMSNTQKAALLVHNVAYWMWVDDDAASPDKGNGLCIMIKPDSAAGYGWSTWYYTNSVMFNMEKLKTKEFSDGYSLWFFNSLVNWFNAVGGNQTSLTKKWAWVLHPWGLPATDDTMGDANDYYYIAQTWWGQRSTGLNSFENHGIKGIDWPVWAALSQGGSPPNVYFMKGIVHAETRYNNKPIGTIQHCFPWREGTGIVDQDIISEPSPSTTKYVCLGKESQTSSTRLTMAIKYAY